MSKRWEGLFSRSGNEKEFHPSVNSLVCPAPMSCHHAVVKPPPPCCHEVSSHLVVEPPERRSIKSCCHRAAAVRRLEPSFVSQLLPLLYWNFEAGSSHKLAELSLAVWRPPEHIGVLLLLRLRLPRGGAITCCCYRGRRSLSQPLEALPTWKGGGFAASPSLVEEWTCLFHCREVLLVWGATTLKCCCLLKLRRGSVAWVKESSTEWSYHYSRQGTQAVGDPLWIIVKPCRPLFTAACQGLVLWDIVNEALPWMPSSYCPAVEFCCWILTAWLALSRQHCCRRKAFRSSVAI